MPLETDGGGPRRVFFEETSLVARPAVTLAECERRLKLRLAHLGIDVVEVCADEPPELCYIPMGGPRPDPRQRVVAFGAAAALVHPATGYQLCRALAAALERCLSKGAKCIFGVTHTDTSFAFFELLTAHGLDYRFAEAPADDYYALLAICKAPAFDDRRDAREMRS